MAKSLTIINYICIYSKRRIVYSMGGKIGDVSILVAEAIAAREARRMTAHLNMDNLLIESDYQIAIDSILNKITV